MRRDSLIYKGLDGWRDLRVSLDRQQAGTEGFVQTDFFIAWMEGWMHGGMPGSEGGLHRQMDLGIVIVLSELGMVIDLAMEGLFYQTDLQGLFQTDSQEGFIPQARQTA